jgi:hypothetical protein
MFILGEKMFEAIIFMSTVSALWGVSAIAMIAAIYND